MIRTSLRRIHRINNNHWERPLKRKLKLTQEKKEYIKDWVGGKIVHATNQQRPLIRIVPNMKQSLTSLLTGELYI